MSRKANTIFHHDRKLQIQFMDDYFSPNKRAGYKWKKRVADEYGKIFITPYLTEPVKEWFYKHDWDDLNRENGQSKQKRHIRNTFTEFDKIGKVKNHINLQKGSGVDVLFETLLKSKKVNIKNRKNTENSKNGVMWMCKDWESVSSSYHSSGNTLEDFYVK